MKRLLFVLTLLLAQSLAFAAGPSALTRTPTDKLNIRLRQQNIQISRDLKIGKLTKDQAKAIKTQVGIIRKAEIADLKANNSKTLTDAQISQLNEQLNNISKNIPIR